MQKQKILITGGAGFIGSSLIKKLVKKPLSLVVIDNLSTGLKENIPSQVKFYKKDIRNKKEIINIFQKEKPSYIVHLAAQTSVNKSLTSPSNDAKINLIGTINLLEAARQFQISKFIFISSAAVYGNQNHFPVKENFRPNPNNPYGCAKESAENYIFLFNKLYNLPFIILRLSNVYGPYKISKKREGGVIDIFCQKMVKGIRPIIYGNGQQTRDFIFVDDVCEAIIKSIFSKKINLILNVSSNQETSLLKIIKIINRSLKTKLVPKKLPAKEGDLKRSNLSNKKIKQELKWRLKTPLKMGIEKTIKYFLKIIDSD